MNEFTLLTVLNSIKRHFLITVALFLVTFWLLPSLNILDNRYTMQKVINIGTAAPGYPVDFLNFEEMHAIAASANTGLFLNNTLGNGRVAKINLQISNEGNIILVLKSHNVDNIVKTANLIMKRFEEFDELNIQKKIRAAIDKPISNKRKFLQIISSQSDHYMVSNADIEKYASMQKIYDTAYDGGDVRGGGSIDLDKIVMLKREESLIKDNLEKQQFKINQEILDLESIKRFGFKKVSYLYPVVSTDSTKYFPNSMIFFGISLLVAFFYNLFILNFLHIKYKKSA